MDPKEDEDITIDANKSKISGNKQIGDLRDDQKPEIFDISENSDEEFSIDFSKIKKFFKREAKEEPQTKTEKKEDSTEHAKLEQKEADEIVVDFSKIKGFFKSDKTETPKAEHSVGHKKADDEIDLSIDFSKIKKFFKSSSEEASQDEIPVNWNSIANFFKKYGVIFIALIPIILSVYIRLQAGFLPFTDDWATNSVISTYKSQIRAEIDKQFPNLPDENKNAIVDTELQKSINQNKRQIDEQIKATSAYFKSFFQDENNKNYMPDIDPYYWFRYAKNILDHGHPGDTLKDGRPYDTYQLAPKGRYVTPDMFHAYFLAYFYKTLHFFAPDLTLMRSLFYYPIFVAALSVLFVFLIARKIAGTLGGFFAGLMMAINAAFLGRTLFGHADSDAWVVFFPLLITWLFTASIDTKSITKIVVLTFIGGLSTAMYSYAWTGWWYIFDFLLVTTAATFGYLVFSNFAEIRRNFRFLISNTVIRNMVIFGLLYFLSTAIFITLFFDWNQFRNSFLGPLSFPSIKEPVAKGLWPNVLTTVAELNEGSINGIVNSVGGVFLFYISLLGIVLSISRTDGIKRFDFVYIILSSLFYAILFARFGKGSPLFESLRITSLLILIALPILIRIAISMHKKDSSYDFKLSILLCLWILSTVFASIKGIRFTLLLAPAFSVAFGVALGKAYTYLSLLITKGLKVHKAIGSSILIAFFILAFFANPTRGAISAASSDPPLVNDAWYNTLSAINKDSGKNAIITSWWDFGHHFKALADRPVTFDGTTQSYSGAHWVGKILMADNELQAIGILRMLDCGGESAYNALIKINNDTHLTIRILNEIILLDEEKAVKKLREYALSEQQIDNVISYTHCNPPEAYFIASEDMIGKSGVWSHFGSWNFERADIWQNAREMQQDDAIGYMMKKFNYTKDKAENIYYEIQAITSDSEANSWVAPWPGYGGTINCNKNENGIYVCSNGLQINLSDYDVFGIGQQGIVRPESAAFTTENGMLKKEFNGTTIGFGITVIPVSEEELEVVLSSRELTGSIFTRMFYMQGHGLKYFKLFDHQRGLTGTDIYTYKVDWQGANTTIIQSYVDMLKKPVKEEPKEITPDTTTNTSLTENTTLTANKTNTS